MQIDPYVQHFVSLAGKGYADSVPESASVTVSDASMGRFEAVESPQSVSGVVVTISTRGAALASQATDGKSENSKVPLEARDKPKEARAEADGASDLDADQEQQLAQLRELRQRDREVRAHEQAHAAVGGHLTGAPSYEYVRGPDGGQYAVAGEVSVAAPTVSNDPEKTLEQAEQVMRAALAPADPSGQDRQVAAAAARTAQQARLELSRMDQEAVGPDRHTNDASHPAEETSPNNP